MHLKVTESVAFIYICHFKLTLRKETGSQAPVYREPQHQKVLRLTACGRLAPHLYHYTNVKKSPDAIMHRVKLFSF